MKKKQLLNLIKEGRYSMADIRAIEKFNDLKNKSNDISQEQKNKIIYGIKNELSFPSNLIKVFEHNYLSDEDLNKVFPRISKYINSIKEDIENTKEYPFSHEDNKNKLKNYLDNLPKNLTDEVMRNFSHYIDDLMEVIVRHLNNGEFVKNVSKMANDGVISMMSLSKMIDTNNNIDLKSSKEDYLKNYGWLVHETRTLDNLISIQQNGFQRGSNFKDLYMGGGNVDLDSDEDYYGFAYNVKEYANDKMNYGTFSVVFKSNFVEIQHNTDKEGQAIFDIRKIKTAIPVFRGEDFKYHIISNTGRIIYTTESIENICNWLDTNYNNYKKILNLKYSNSPKSEKARNQLETTLKKLMGWRYIN